MSEKFDLEELERKAKAAADEASVWWRPGAHAMEHIAANAPSITLALISRILELEMALADALYWLKPGLDDKAHEMAEERARLSQVLR